ncbi:hypothetical protein XENOCAPTIV_027716 [Xenoophorus captivus]|uniref:Secreted protein n=1 Tax=Xenoophorus captivus TaxID=1517983 RepID=A0ABV0RX49_9TELE
MANLAWFITWPVGLAVCVALSAVTGCGESGELGSESQSKEKYPLDERRGGRKIDLLRNTSKLAGLMEQGCESESGSSPPPAVTPGCCAPLRCLCFEERGVRAEDAGSPPVPSAGVTSVEPSRRFGGLLDEQSVTVSVGFHPSAPLKQPLCVCAASGAAAAQRDCCVTTGLCSAIAYF